MTAALFLAIFASLIFAHLASFQVSHRLKIRLSGHVARMPLGRVRVLGTGKLYATIDNSVGEVASFIAHLLSEFVMSILTPVF